MARLLEFLFVLAVIYGMGRYIWSRVTRWRYRRRMMQDMRVGDMIEFVDTQTTDKKRNNFMYLVRWGVNNVELTPVDIDKDVDPSTISREAKQASIIVPLENVVRNAFYDERREKAIKHHKVRQMEDYMSK